MFRRFTAKTVQDAVNLACQELNVTVDDLNYEVISETKTFSLKSRNRMLHYSYGSRIY